jgi:uncharacterized membrane protein
MVLNLFKRLGRHLFISPLALKKRFPKAVMQRIEQAIAESEQSHLGEIRFAVELNLPLLDILRKKSGQQRAVEVFSQLQVWDTEQNNGVLLYLLLADHDFEILADRGIHQHVGKQGWARISHEMEMLFKQGQFEAGVLHGITQINNLLSQHYPATTNNHNELPNAPVII